MPYIEQSERLRLDRGGVPWSVGQLTYAYTVAVLRNDDELVVLAVLRRTTDKWIGAHGTTFHTLADVLGALSATELELNRRLPPHARFAAIDSFKREFYTKTVEPYEKSAIVRNNDLIEYSQSQGVA